MRPRRLLPLPNRQWGSLPHAKRMNLLLIGPGRIGQALLPLLQAAGHEITVRTREAYGDFLLPTYNATSAIDNIDACDAVLLLAGAFQLNANVEAMGQANATGPIRIAEAVHAKFPHAQVIAFLDARIDRPPETLPKNIRAYMDAKRRLAQWVRDAARTWGRMTGTRVNAIAPGPVLPPPDKAHSEKAGECLTPRPTIEDIFAAVTFLLTTPSVTGQILYVAAGQQLL